ncbi:MAG: oligosaccharide flippase family protein [Blautia sp.]|nr:oligosaccharide flippase family protein [Lachnoclostridium sp.]MCM1211527.1 oligosaccharide flippase family protein [Blautia sp.]
MGRVRQTEKNIFFGVISNFIILIIGFIQVKVFIRVLGRTLLGIDSLYTDILGILSLAELGVGAALNYSLYKPVAEQNREKIKSYMLFYKKAYRCIAGLVAVIGLILTPFLPYIISEEKRGSISIESLTIYYLVFLFNTVSTYFVAYKYSLANAEQKNYIQTNITTITKIITSLVQIVVLWVTENFLLYLLTRAAIELIQKIFASFYLNRLYPYLKEKQVQKLEKEETAAIAEKTKAQMLHKIGDAARLSTDSIIISAMVDLDAVGLVSNYNKIITYAANFVNIIFDSAIASFGNLVATESREKQLRLFKVYRFFACWMYGFAAVGFWLLLTPFIAGIYLDKSWALGQGILTLILVDFYLKGSRIVLFNFKTAAGIFSQDKYLAFIQGGVNLVVSIIAAKWIGLAGVYVGTVISGIIANLVRPFIIYRDCFGRSAWEYFKDSLKYICVVAGIALLLVPVKNILLSQVNLWTFLLAAALVSVVYHLIFVLIFRKTAEFQYLWTLAAGKLPFLGRRKNR